MITFAQTKARLCPRLALRDLVPKSFEFESNQKKFQIESLAVKSNRQIRNRDLN